MPRKSKIVASAAVTWLSDTIVDPNCLSSSYKHYEKFQFENIVAAIGDFVLISNADAAEPDTEDGCDAARIVSLYEDSTNNNDPFRAKVQWYSKPSDLPDWCHLDSISFLEKEVIEDHRPFNTDVSIETFFKKCSINFTFTRNTEHHSTAPYHYICRYRLLSLSKRKVNIEPVMEEERRALHLLNTPMKNTSSPKTPKSLIKRMNRLSMSEQTSWSISKTQGTKLLLKKAILTDKIERDSPKKNRTPKITLPETLKTPKVKNNFEEIISMELEEDSDEELPTLIIREHIPTTPKRKQSITKTTDVTPKKSLFLEEDHKSPHTVTRSGRNVKSKINYREEEVSPVKRTPRRAKKASESEEEFKVESITKIRNETPKKVFGEDQTTTVTRSGRCVKKKINYMEEMLSPVKQTPRRARQNTESDDEFKPVKTPLKISIDTPKRTPRKTQKVLENDEEFTPVPKTPQTPRTPAHSAKKSVSRKILCQLTPSLRTRVHSIDETDEFVKENKSLTGREKQMDEILSFIKNKLLDRSSGCMYISGVPGTGKTATVSAALNILKEDVDLPEFQLVEINGMRIAEPRQAYVQIYKQLTGKTVVWEQACSLLEKRFTNPGPRRTPTVLLVDELDALCTRRQDVLYSIMEWAAHNTALLTVLAVANTMDLPERALEARVASRLGLTRLTFPPYTHTQLQQIVATRLAGANVTPDALQLIARKVAAVSGDARRAIALSTRAIELAGAGGAGLLEVQKALNEASSSPVVTAIKYCSPAERLMLRAVAAEVERTGSDETTLSRALSTATAIVSLDGRPYRSAPHVRAPTPSQAKAICSRLAALRLLLFEPKPSEPRILLNVSPDDVHYATKQIAV